MEICNQYIPNVCHSGIHSKYTIDISNHNMTSQANWIYNLEHLDFLKPITFIGYNSKKYAIFLSNDLSPY